MRAIMVCVDYSDLLSITLPYNRHHFEEIVVVTSPQDAKTVGVVFSQYDSSKISVFQTNAFYENGATFNKWKALEQGLDAMGRHGWLCIMDADVLWPKKLPPFAPVKGKLYTPKRRMWEEWPKLDNLFVEVDTVRVGDYPETSERAYVVPKEDQWSKFPLHRQMVEFAGYSQIFHADDPVLGLAPWHETDWKHAGGADSFFQAKWSDEKKIRPPFEVLHLGPAGQNWMGRATPLVDGTVPEGAEGKLKEMGKVWSGRRDNRAAGRDQFDGERIS